MPTVDQIATLCRLADALVLSARKAYPNASDQAIHSVCDAAITMALDPADDVGGNCGD